ncbi:MAG: hypothetical protein JW950_00885 [Deltaproteobacteria bacterium]|nr:hypothetical protein [Deltaproteobacteria bacterium]
MLISAEIRWFWHKRPAPGIDDWFLRSDVHPCAAGGGMTRVDRYLRNPCQGELGIKRRGGVPGIEVKGLVKVTWGGLTADPFSGPVELWAKWTVESLELEMDALIAVEKRRWLRKFDTTDPLPREVPMDEEGMPPAGRPLPVAGCNVELTRVGLSNGDIWWTLGFEAFGTIMTAERDLRTTAKALADRRPPSLAGGLLASYPGWLDKHAAR